MVSLVIEEVRQHPRQRRFLRLAGHVAIAQRAGEGIIAEATDEAEDACVFARARRPESGEFIIEDLIESLDAARGAFEAAHPDAIADEDVVERGVDRTEEGRSPRAVVVRA